MAYQCHAVEKTVSYTIVTLKIHGSKDKCRIPLYCPADVPKF